MAAHLADVETHADPHEAPCLGQWCCGCTEHPTGKPWGWNHRAWLRHFAEHHPEKGVLTCPRCASVEVEVDRLMAEVICAACGLRLRR